MLCKRFAECPQQVFHKSVTHSHRQRCFWIFVLNNNKKKKMISFSALPITLSLKIQITCGVFQISY